MSELDRRSKVSRTQIDLVLKGERQITILRGAMLAHAFGLRLTDMLKEQLPSAGIAREQFLVDEYRKISDTHKDVVDQVVKSFADSD